MDAAALLKSQGWRGKGHTLHSSDDSVGLASRLLVSRNTDGRGIGVTQHYTSDQWWLNAFDEKLKGLDTSQKGRVVQSVTAGKLDAVATAATGKGTGKYAGANGLYSAFVSGGLLDGTITPEEERTDATPASEDNESVIGLRDGLMRRSTVGETKGEKILREAKRSRKETRERRRAARLGRKRNQGEKKEKKILVDKALRQAANDTKSAGESKEDRRGRRAERRARKEERRRKREQP